MSDIMNISGIECYEKDGVAYLKLETCARGLGFTTVATSGNEVVRWKRVEKYLSELGFPSKLGKDDFIPENIFYRLAMKAKNEAAEAFQAKIADEVIPSIRKTGEMSAINSYNGVFDNICSASKQKGCVRLERRRENMNELIKIDYSNDKPSVSARDLHEFLEVGADFRHWFPRMCEYGFAEGQDFNSVKIDRVQNEGNRLVTRVVEDAAVSIEMAKEICMLQRNEKGKMARQYFIQLEKYWNSPEKVMARALRIAEQQIITLKMTNSVLTVDNQIMKPKADYFDELVDRKLLTNFRETAKELQIKQNDFVKFLLDKKYLYRDGRGKLLPYADKNDGLFEVKECFNDKTQWSGTQTLITPKGRETFRLLCLQAS